MNTEFKLRLIIKFEVKWRSKLEPNKNKLERSSSANVHWNGISKLVEMVYRNEESLVTRFMRLHKSVSD